MKRFIPLFLISFSFLFMVSSVLAHSDSNGQGSMDKMMEEMMGDSVILELMEMMEDQMMGDQQHERMETLMDKMLDGTLSAQEQQEMIGLMQDPQAGPGAMTMMMRIMSPNVMKRGVFASPTGMMGFNAWSIVYWITVILVWIVLISGIVAIWKWLISQKTKR